MDVANFGRLMVALGLGIAAVGGMLWAAARWAPGLRLGRLPGDIVIDQGGFKLFFPITTMVLASIALTLILWLLGALRR